MIPHIHLGGIELGPLTIYPWGIMSAIALLVGVLLIAREAENRKCSKEHVYGVAFWMILAGLIGARLWHFIFYEETFSIIEFIRFYHGGFAFFGAIIGGLIAMAAYIFYYKLRFLKYADLFAIYAPFGHFIARIGCLLTGEHLGTETNLPWAMNINGVGTHPVIIYEMIGLIAMFLIMLKLRKKELRRGFLFLAYVGMYSILRVAEDFFRSPLTDAKYYGLTGTQYGAVAVILFVGIYYFIWKNTGKGSEKNKENKEEE